MSYILESIKQAERERKAGKQVPTISIEYTGEHVEDIDDNKMQWMMLTMGLIATAIVVWGTTYYFTNKDQKYIAESSAGKTAEKPIEPVTTKQNIVLKPVENIHTSNLKSVRVIEDEEILLASQQLVEQQQSSVKISNALPSKNNSAKLKDSHTTEVKPKAVPVVLTEAVREEKNANIFQATEESNKRELVAIYSDLAELAKVESVTADSESMQPVAEEDLMQIETVSSNVLATVDGESRQNDFSASSDYAAPKVSSYEAQHEQAVSTGVPSFGELPYDIQEQIPDFNVSVHMFHADPLQRRIRINGQMYTEGKNLQQDLALVEITRYGAVFDYQGHLFRLNVR